jgi:arylsulfatase
MVTMRMLRTAGAVTLVLLATVALWMAPANAQQKRPNIVMLMTDDTGWGDFGYISGGGKALGHPTPNIDRIAKEGAVFTNWMARRVAPRAAPRS